MENNNNKNRTILKAVRMNEDEINMIKEKANGCGMEISTYLRECALNHEPKNILMKEEWNELKKLTDIRTDIINFFNALKGKSQEERRIIFRSIDFMRQWLGLVSVELKKLDTFLDNINRRRGL
jgi:hypothetical protein